MSRCCGRCDWARAPWLLLLLAAAGCASATGVHVTAVDLPAGTTALDAHFAWSGKDGHAHFDPPAGGFSAQTDFVVQLPDDATGPLRVDLTVAGGSCPQASASDSVVVRAGEFVPLRLDFLPSVERLGCSGSDAGMPLDAAPDLGAPDAAHPAVCDGGDPHLCDVFAQTGCPCGMACDFDFRDGGAHLCRPATNAPEGHLCAGSNDCAPGADCLTVSSIDGGAACYRACRRDGDCRGPGSRCVLEITTGLAHFCTVDCDPFADTTCAPSWACRIFPVPPDAGAVFSDCQPTGASGFGGFCTSSNDCARDEVCGGIFPTCATICQPGDGTCTFPESCQVIAPVPRTGALIGYCGGL